MYLKSQLRKMKLSNCYIVKIYTTFTWFCKHNPPSILLLVLWFYRINIHYFFSLSLTWVNFLICLFFFFTFSKWFICCYINMWVIRWPDKIFIRWHCHFSVLVDSAQFLMTGSIRTYTPAHTQWWSSETNLNASLDNSLASLCLRT